jgi:hypothetical protein
MPEQELDAVFGRNLRLCDDDADIHIILFAFFLFVLGMHVRMHIYVLPSRRLPT